MIMTACRTSTWFLIFSLLLVFNRIKADQFVDCRSIQCKRSYIICVDNENCEIDCGFFDRACQSSIIICPENGHCRVNCDSREACDKATIYAQKSNTLTLYCENHDESCYFLDVYCPQNKGPKTCTISGFDAYDLFEMAIYATNGFVDVQVDIATSLPAMSMHCNNNFDETCIVSPTFPHTNCLNDNVTCNPTLSPTQIPTNIPTSLPTNTPTLNPTLIPTISPTLNPTFKPTNNPIITPTHVPSHIPTKSPTINPSINPTNVPTNIPTNLPTLKPTDIPTNIPSQSPTNIPTNPSINPTNIPTLYPTTNPSNNPTNIPMLKPTNQPTIHHTNPTHNPSNIPTINPTLTNIPSVYPTVTNNPTNNRTNIPTINPITTHKPTNKPTAKPSKTSRYQSLMTTTQTYQRFDLTGDIIYDIDTDEADETDEQDEEAKSRPITINLTNLMYVVVGVVFICCIVCGFCFVFNMISQNLSSFSKTFRNNNNINYNNENNGFVLRRSSNSSSSFDLGSESDEDLCRMFESYQKRERSRFSQSINNNKRVSMSTMNGTRCSILVPVDEVLVPVDEVLDDDDDKSECESQQTDDGIVNNNKLSIPQQTNDRLLSIDSLPSGDINYLIDIIAEQQDRNLQADKDNKNEEKKLNDDKFSMSLITSILNDNELNDHIINDINHREYSD